MKYRLKDNPLVVVYVLEEKNGHVKYQHPSDPFVSGHVPRSLFKSIFEPCT